MSAATGENHTGYLNLTRQMDEEEAQCQLVEVLDANDADILARTTSSPRVLTVLARHFDPGVRLSVAQNPATSARIIAELMSDPDLAVQASAQVHPSRAVVLPELERAGEAWQEARAAERLTQLACYTAIKVAANAGIPETRIAEYAQVDRMTVRRALGKL